MSDKLRLDFFLSIGGKLVGGDVYTAIDGTDVVVPDAVAYINAVNTIYCNDNKRFIKSFAKRENKDGVMPCDGDLPVIVHRFTDNLDLTSGRANSFSWGNGSQCIYDIEYWQPDLNELIKTQKEHDEPVSYLSAGYIVECIKSCIMDGGCEVAATKGSRYKVVSIDYESRRFIIIDNNKREHRFAVDEGIYFRKFKIQKELSRPKKEEPKIYTQAMADAGELPEVGMDFLVFVGSNTGGLDDFDGRVVSVISIVKLDDKDVITFSHEKIGVGCGCYHESWVKPIDTRTEKEKVTTSKMEDYKPEAKAPRGNYVRAEFSQASEAIIAFENGVALYEEWEFNSGWGFCLIDSEIRVILEWDSLFIRKDTAQAEKEKVIDEISSLLEATINQPVKPTAEMFYNQFMGGKDEKLRN